MNHRKILALSGASLAIATICGALGAHALKASLSPASLEAFETGVRYQFYHSLGLMGIGVLASMPKAAPRLGAAAWLLIVGIVLFSGSLYALALGAPRALGVVTPVGGLALILGWITFVVAVRPAD